MIDHTDARFPDTAAREVAWHDAVTDAMADGASRQDAEENADRYVREQFDEPEPEFALPCMACEQLYCDGSCIR